ncbi:hypothetical protein AB990_08990 [Alkalihalobacillus pseudalcaliphilus]|nr:hypothetical protein AB990_08990 [Alkalihalobacillus pseudalcaliphilus]
MLTPAQLAVVLTAIQAEIDALERYATPEPRPELERYYDELIAARTQLRYTYRKLNESERVP